MRKELKFIFLLFLLSILSVNVYGAKRYWVGGTSNSWKNTANWSSTTGGSGGFTIPGSSDTAIFDGGSTSYHWCVLDSLVNVKRLFMSADTLSQGAYTITMGSAGGNLTGGVFYGGSASITSGGAFTIAGNSFTSTSGTFSIAGSLTFSGGSFTHNSGKLKFTATGTITVSTGTGLIALYQLELAPASTSTYTITSGDTLSVSNTFTMSGSSAAIINTGVIIAKGDIVITNTSGSGTGTATLTINGSGTQTITGTAGVGEGKLPNVIINKTSGTLQLANIISVYGNWTWTAGTISAGTSTVHFANTLTITGRHALYNVNFSGTATRTFTIASGDTLTVNGTMVITGTNGVTLNTGVINAKGDIKIRNTSIAGGGTATIYISDTLNQTFTGGLTAGEGKLPNIKINKSSGTLTLDSLICVGGNWTYTNGMGGNLNAGASTVHFANTLRISGTHTLYNTLFTATTTRTFTIAPTDTLTSTGLVSISGTAAINLDSGILSAKGHITISNSSTAATGSAKLLINGSGSQILTGTGTAGAGRLPKITIDKTGGTLTLASVITVYGDWIYTKGTVSPGSSTVVLYGTANLDGQLSAGTTLMAFNTLAFAGNTTLTGSIDVNNNLSIGNGATLSAGSHSIYCGGTWNNTNGTWTYGTGTVIFDGSSYRQIKRTVGGGAAANETFYNLRFNRRGGSQTLANPVTVNNVLTLTDGRVKSTNTNYLLLIDGATLVGGNDSAYVHGPVKKKGNDAFIFPLGDTTLADTAYHPLTMTAPSNVGDQFSATYFALNQTYGDSLVDSLASISQCEYWTFGRDSGTSTPLVAVGWNKNSCNVDDYDGLRLASWNGVKWLDLGVTSVAVTDFKGTLTGYATPGYSVNPVPILIGNPANSYQYALLKKKLDGGYYQAINGRLFFRYDEEYNDADGHLTFNIYEDEAENISPPITSNTSLPLALRPQVAYGDNRYRLNTIQCDFTNTGGPLPNGFYILEVINEKNEHWYLRFKNYSTISVVCGPIPD